MDRLRQAVPKDRMLAFVNAHKAEIASLASNFDKTKAVKLGAELFFQVDREKLSIVANASKLSG